MIEHVQIDFQPERCSFCHRWFCSESGRGRPGCPFCLREQVQKQNAEACRLRRVVSGLRGALKRRAGRTAK